MVFFCGDVILKCPLERAYSTDRNLVGGGSNYQGLVIFPKSLREVAKSLRMVKI